MFGLIKKDLLLIKGNFKSIIIVCVIFFVMNLNGIQNITYFLPLMCVMIGLTTFSYDEYNKWDAYAISLPNGRKNCVRSKYISTFILILIGVILSLFATLFVSFIKNVYINYEEMLALTIAGIVVTALLISIIYPLIYKYGIEKARIMLFVFVFLISSIVGIVFSKLNLDISKYNYLFNFIQNFWYIIIPILLIFIVTSSYLISDKIYSKKEF